MKPLLLALALVISSPAFAADQTPPGDNKDFKGRLTDFRMLDEKTGWASSTDSGSLRLLRTDDGGRHWRDVSPFVVTYDASGGAPEFEVQFGFLDANTGCVAMPTKANDGLRLYATRDGGAHWNEAKIPGPIYEGVEICFVDKLHVFLAEESDPATGKSRKAIFRSTDGGLSWEQMAVDPSKAPREENEPTLPYLGLGCAISFRSETEGWCSASPRGDQTIYLYHTTDAGKTWRPQPLTWPDAQKKGYAEASVPQFFGAAKKEGLLVVRFIQHEPESYLLATYLTHDGGKTWALRGTCPFDWNWEQVSYSFSDQDHGVFIRDKRVFRTTDGGKTWNEIKTDSTPADTYPIELQFLTPDTGAALIDNTESQTSSLLQTHDGGATWARIF